jgi:hypothetical protein
VEEGKKSPGLTKLVETENGENVKAVFHFHHRGLRESSIKLLRARVEGEEGSEVEGKKIRDGRVFIGGQSCPGNRTQTPRPIRSF